MDQLSKTRRGLSALLPSRKHFDVLAQELPIGVYELDADARFVYVNERWSELTGVSPELGEIWAVPRAGGEARRVASFEQPAFIDRMALAGEAVPLPQAVTTMSDKNARRMSPPATADLAQAACGRYEQAYARGAGSLRVGRSK